MSNREIEPKKKQVSKLSNFKGGFILAGLTFILGLLWGIVSPFSMVGQLAQGLFGEGLFSFPYTLGIYFVIFLYGSLINFINLKISTSNSDMARELLGLLRILLVGFYLVALILGFLGNG